MLAANRLLSESGARQSGFRRGRSRSLRTRSNRDAVVRVGYSMRRKGYCAMLPAHRNDRVDGVAPAAAHVEDAKLAAAGAVNERQARRHADGEPAAVRGVVPSPDIPAKAR
jgi:hypothetical protein